MAARWPVVMQHTMAAGRVCVCVFDNHTFPRVVSSISSPSSLLCLSQHPHLSSLLSAVTHCGCRPGLEGGTGWVVVGGGDGVQCGGQWVGYGCFLLYSGWLHKDNCVCV